MRPALLLLAITVLLTACASAPSKRAGDDTFDLEEAMRFHRERPASAPVSGPLGAPTNPVRANGPAGQRHYLSRLRCKNGRAPEFSRIGSSGIGPYGKMIDAYRVECAGEAERVVYMDLYHCEEESHPVPGFQIVPPTAPPLRVSCS